MSNYFTGFVIDTDEKDGTGWKVSTGFVLIRSLSLLLDRMGFTVAH